MALSIDDLKAKKAKLEFHMEQAVNEKNAISAQIEEMKPQIEANFGTSDLGELSKIAKEIEANIEASIEELKNLGVTI